MESELTDAEIIAAYRATPRKRTQARPLGMEKLSRGARLAVIADRVAYFGRSTGQDMDVYLNSDDISYTAYRAAIHAGFLRRKDNPQ